MPRLIDYGVRFEFIREAVLRVCVRDGARALSAAAVAAEMQISVATLRRTMARIEALPALGAGFIMRQRAIRARVNRGRVGLTPVQLAQHILERELPLDEERLHEELAWSQIVHTFRDDDSVRKYWQQHEDDLDAVMSGLAKLLEVPEEVRPREILRLRALHSGLASGICAGRVTADDARAVVQAHVAELASRGSDQAPATVA